MAEKKGPPLSAFVSPEGALVLAAAGATAALAAMPVVLVPGVVAYGILTWLRVERWKERRAAGGEVDLTPASPSTEGLPHHLAQRAARAVAVQQGILRTIAEAEPHQRALLAPNADRVRALVVAAVDLSRKLAELERYFAGGDARRAAEETAALEARVQRTRDPAAQGELARALEQQRAKLRVEEELAARAQRLDAQLTTIQVTLDTVAAQVLRIKSADAVVASTESARVEETLRDLAIDVDALAETVDETAAPSASSFSKGARP